MAKLRASQIGSIDNRAWFQTCGNPCFHAWIFSQIQKPIGSSQHNGAAISRCVRCPCCQEQRSPPDRSSPLSTPLSHVAILMPIDCENCGGLGTKFLSVFMWDYISLHGKGNASSIASRSTTAIGRGPLSGCLRIYSNAISTTWFV